MGKKTIGKKDREDNMIFTDLSESDRKDLIEYISYRKRYTVDVIEKDWWVTSVLKALFELPYSGHLSLKGGTSLSKCWRLINRMSEDADIGINREFFGFTGELSKNQISDKLRRATCTFVRDKMSSDLQEALLKQGISPDLFKVEVKITPVTTTDPETIYVSYDSLFNHSDYILPQVKVEVSGRSMIEPVNEVKIQSFILEEMVNLPFNEETVNVNAVAPERTFLEKLFLLHEEFAKPTQDIRVERMSRHFYDICQILKTDIWEKALLDNDLYQAVIEHRKKFIGLKGFDYSTLNKQTLKITPIDSQIKNKWKKDYEDTILNMVLGEAESFEEVIGILESLNKKINEEF